MALIPTILGIGGSPFGERNPYKKSKADLKREQEDARQQEAERAKLEADRVQWEKDHPYEAGLERADDEHRKQVQDRVDAKSADAHDRAQAQTAYQELRRSLLEIQQQQKGLSKQERGKLLEEINDLNAAISNLTQAISIAESNHGKIRTFFGRPNKEKMDLQSQQAAKEGELATIQSQIDQDDQARDSSQRAVDQERIKELKSQMKKLDVKYGKHLFQESDAK